MELALLSSEVAETLGIGSSTLRKYALALEEGGYQFERGQNNARLFYNRDIVILKQFITAVNKNHMPVENAVKLAVELQKKQIVTPPAPYQGTPVATLERFYSTLENIDRNQEKLIQINMALYKQQELLNQRAKERDKLLLENIRLSQSNSQQVRKGFFRKLGDLFKT
ncbi:MULTISPECIES: hypothetical protein [Bacillus]|uniref:HTH merR-type domain-containing protein n=1 Tax=Bacillus glycinifermentans TaxID=1664069 RepID=A0A0T6BI51_9BACI|nr:MULTISPECIES: hypothetical protein [Bacillus]KRT87055.1 hypothetical protein AB447_208800 [Bacillus glycinifermentans]MEC0341891.1 hypothetical protein [Bacillus sonorensis]MEC0457423.1 hypothetical protein [Bacillus sonorensis]MEC0487106.1 hypothetical protein [Bacillus glycinifermentans]MEC0530782.1 hypothetical protein [Bacillus sonorensis]